MNSITSTPYKSIDTIPYGTELEAYHVSAFTIAPVLRVGSLALIGLSANERRQNEDKGREDCFWPFFPKERSKVTNLVL